MTVESESDEKKISLELINEDGIQIKAAQLQLRILVSLQRTIPEGYLISMGDFNDNPSNKSVSLLVKKNEVPITPAQSQDIKNGYRENGLYEFFELQHIRVF